MHWPEECWVVLFLRFAMAIAFLPLGVFLQAEERTSPIAPAAFKTSGAAATLVGTLFPHKVDLPDSHHALLCFKAQTVLCANIPPRATYQFEIEGLSFNFLVLFHLNF